MSDEYAPFEKHKKMHKKADTLADGLDLDHMDVYTSSVRKVLGDEPDYERLNESGVREDLKETMAKDYQARARKRLKSSIKPEDKMENDMLTQAVYGTTENILGEQMDQHKENFTLTAYKGLSKDITDKTRARLKGVAAQHIKEEHMQGAVDYTESGNVIDYKKMTKRDVIALLDHYHTHGEVMKAFYKGKLFDKTKVAKPKKAKSELEALAG
jgi:hypothetical protein